MLYPLLQILELVKGMHYQLACQKYFELTHNVSADFNLEWGLEYLHQTQVFRFLTCDAGRLGRETQNCHHIHH